MRIRKATLAELDRIMMIYDGARSYMREQNNPTQWGGGYPSRELIREDIERERCHVCEEDGEILGIFYYAEEKDPTYAHIDGTWQNDRPYGVLHRIAVAARGRGVASFCFEECFARCKNLKVDTHRDNIPMQRALEKNGFTLCGTIYLENGDPRLAYQKSEKI